MVNPPKQACPLGSVVFETPFTVNVAPARGCWPGPSFTFLAVFVTRIAADPRFVYVHVTWLEPVTVMSAWAGFVPSCFPLAPAPVAVHLRLSRLKPDGSEPSVTV